MRAKAGFLAVSGMCVGVTVMAVLTVWHRPHRPSTKVFAANRQPDPLAVASQTPAPAPRCSDGDDKDRAWCEFQSLTASTTEWMGDDTKRPIWVNWDDKCDLQLPTCSNSSTTPRNDKQNLIKDALVARQPVQKSHTVPNASAAGNHELASVLFSPELHNLLTSLKTQQALDNAVANVHDKTGTDRELPDNGLSTTYATAIKLIWEIAYPTVFIYNGKPNDGYQESSSGKAAKFSAPSGWSAHLYNVDPNESLHCSNGNLSSLKNTDSYGAGPVPSIPVNCFYHVILDPADAEQMQLMRMAGVNVLNQNPPIHTKAMAILVGVHMMVISPLHPQWQWMTFYWTPQTNGQGSWKDPWQHYQMVTASTNKEGGTLTAIGGNNSNDIANPYLEAHLDGMHTNCISCHSLAVYKEGGNNQSPARRIVDKQACSAGPGYPKTETVALAKNFFVGGVRTHFLWSLANIGESTPAEQQPSIGCQ